MTERKLLPTLAVYLVGYLAFCTAFFYLSSKSSIEIYHLALITIVGFAIFVCSRIAKMDPSFTTTFYFSCVFCVFHFGIAPVFLMPDEMWSATQRFNFHWYLDLEPTSYSHVISLIFLGGLLASGLFLNTSTQIKFVKQHNVADIYNYSIWGLLLSIGAWIFLLRATGAADYADFGSKVEISGFGAYWGLVHSAINAFVMLAVLSGRAKLPITIFLAWGSFAFQYGLRGEVAFPLVLILAVLVAQKRIKLPIWLLSVGAVSLLAVSSIISVTRVSSSVDSTSVLQVISSGLAELGGSLRPVYEVVNWVYSDGFQLGTTYYAPFERTFLGLIPIAARLPGDQDFRLMNVLIMDRAGPFGFSIAAEAYYNFGLVGCFLVGSLSGYILNTATRNYIMGKINIADIALCFGLFEHIRQSFVTCYGTGVSVAIFSAMVLIPLRLFATRPRFGS